MSSAGRKPKITDAFLTEVAAGLYHSVSREWAMKMAQELIERRKKAVPKR